MNKSIYTADLTASFPSALQADKTLTALAQLVATPLSQFANETHLASLYANIDHLPEAVLDALAFDFKVDWYDYSYDLDKKRKTIRNSWNVHRQLGTKYAVKTAISAIYPETTVEEWFEYDGEPYCFRLKINLNHVVADPQAHQRVLQRLRYYKNLRSHMEEIFYQMNAESDFLHLGGCMSAITTLPLAELPDHLEFTATERLGATVTNNITLPLPEVG